MILTHWQHTNFYQTVNDSEQNQKIAMGWLAISGIIFGGINDQNMLAGWLQVLLKKKVKYGIFKMDTYPPPVSKKEEFHMKQTTLTQRLLSALVALCMVLSVCAPAFADVTDPDMAKAAQWCTEQGTMDAKGDRFEPEGWTPKFKVIEVWNKAFPAA